MTEETIVPLKAFQFGLTTPSKSERTLHEKLQKTIETHVPKDSRIDEQWAACLDDDDDWCALGVDGKIGIWMESCRIKEGVHRLALAGYGFKLYKADAWFVSYQIKKGEADGTIIEGGEVVSYEVTAACFSSDYLRIPFDLLRHADDTSVSIAVRGDRPLTAFFVDYGFGLVIPPRVNKNHRHDPRGIIHYKPIDKDVKAEYLRDEDKPEDDMVTKDED